MTPEVCTHELVRGVLEFGLTIGRNFAAVDLIALAIIVVLSCDEYAALVASGAILVPDVVNC